MVIVSLRILIYMQFSIKVIIVQSAAKYLEKDISSTTKLFGGKNMRALIDDGIIKQEICYQINGDTYLFRFQIFQLSESKFIIRPLEDLFCPKENNEDKAFFTKFKYDDNTHSKIAVQDKENRYMDLLDYIYENYNQACNNLVNVCTGVFNNNSTTVTIYYLRPLGILFKLIEFDKVEFKMDLYDDNGNIIVTLGDDD